MKESMHQLVSVIIPHHNNFKILESCIDSLKKSTYKNYEIIIVDNNSTDGSIEKIKNKYIDIAIKRMKNNIGYAGACNVGAEIAGGEFLLFLNNDTIHEIDFISHLLNKIGTNKKIAAVQPKIKNYDNKEYFDYAGASGGFIDYLVFPFTRGRIFNTIEQDNGQYNQSMKVFWTSGTCFITRKDLFNKLNGFDEKLFAHMEEIDYCWKCYLAGYECWVEPKAVVYHHGGKTLSYNSPKKTYYNHRNSLILLLTNYRLGLSLFLFPFRLILEVLSSINDLLKLKFFHFVAHYISLLSILFNIGHLFKRRKLNKKIRRKDDEFILSQKIIYKESIVKKYFILKRKKYINF